jgi:hypothetical protein
LQLPVVGQQPEHVVALPSGVQRLSFWKRDAAVSFEGLPRKAYGKSCTSSLCILEYALAHLSLCVRLCLALVEIDSHYTDADVGNTRARRLWTLDEWKTVMRNIQSVQSEQNYVILSFVDPTCSSQNYCEAANAVLKTASQDVQHEFLVWHRTNATNSGGDRFTSSAEIIILTVVGERRKAAPWSRNTFSNGSQNRHNVIELDEVPMNAKLRKTGSVEPVNTMQKPVSLYYLLLALLVAEQKNVLSVCSGTGSMAMACLFHQVSCDSVDVDGEQLEASYHRLQKAVADYATGSNVDEIQAALDNLAAYKLVRSYVANKKLKELFDRSKASRAALTNLLRKPDEKEHPVCKLCKRKITVAATSYLCGKGKCGSWLHKECLHTKQVDGVPVCSQECATSLKADVEQTVKADSPAPAAAAAAPARAQTVPQVGAGTVGALFPAK